jgi:hypothetical protein
VGGIALLIVNVDCDHGAQSTSHATGQIWMMAKGRYRHAKSSPMNSILADLDAASEAAAKAGKNAKKAFSQELSRRLAQKVANALRSSFTGVLPSASGGRSESRARTAKGFKRLDVNYSTIELGLGLGISIKTTNAPEGPRQNYAKNVTGRDAELRAEAEDYHERQPYAVLVALYFVPDKACHNATRNAPSSFATIARTLRFRSGRSGPKDLTTLFEAAYIGLYREDDPDRGSIVFFDVTEDPPRSGRPSRTKQFDEVLADINALFVARNGPFKWADDSDAAPAAPEQLEPGGLEDAQVVGDDDDEDVEDTA